MPHAPFPSALRLTNRRPLRRAPLIALTLFAAVLWSCGGTRTPSPAAGAGAENGSENGSTPRASTPQSTVDSVNPRTRQTLLDSGQVYYQACAICHGGNGRGGRGPAVANSDYVQGDRTRLIRTVLEGVHEPIHVNGVRWKTGEMLGWADVWDDFKIAAVLTYIRVALNDSTVTACIPEDFETGTWASCTLVPRTPDEIARDSIAVDEVAAVRKNRVPGGE